MAAPYAHLYTSTRNSTVVTNVLFAFFCLSVHLSARQSGWLYVTPEKKSNGGETTIAMILGRVGHYSLRGRVCWVDAVLSFLGRYLIRHLLVHLAFKMIMRLPYLGCIDDCSLTLLLRTITPNRVLRFFLLFRVRSQVGIDGDQYDQPCITPGITCCMRIHTLTLTRANISLL